MESKPPIISLDVKEETFQNVIEILSIASGYNIIAKNKFEDFLVNIKLENITLKEALNRCLKDYNHAIVWDHTEKIISLFVYGVIVPQKGIKTPHVRGSDVGRTYKHYPDTSLSFSGDTHSGIGRVHEQFPGALPSISGMDTHFVQVTETTD